MLALKVRFPESESFQIGASRKGCSGSFLNGGQAVQAARHV